MTIRQGVLSSDERGTLAVIADLLIPRTSGMPSASDADVQGEYIDRVFGVRADLIDAVSDGLKQIAAPLPTTFDELLARDLPGFRPLAEAVTAAYFLNPTVAQLIGYRKRSAIPIRFDEDLAGLVEPVSSRGPIYRPTPGNGETDRGRLIPR